MQPRILFAFWDVSIYCWRIFNFSSTNSPKSSFPGLLSVHSLPSLYLSLVLPCPKSRTLHLVLLTSWWLHRPISEAFHSPSVWKRFPLAFRPHHTAWCHWQTFLGCTQSPCPYCQQMLNSAKPSTDSWEMPLIAGVHLDIEPLITRLWEWPSSRLLIHQVVHLSNPCFSNLNQGCLVGLCQMLLQ